VIAHVAEAGEGSGRVVLQLGPHVSPLALRAAVQVARSFRSEIEGLYAEDGKLMNLAAFPFAREITLSGTVKGPFDTVLLQRRQHRTAAAVLRRAAAAAHEAGIRFISTLRNDDAASALAKACAERGPWNMVALGEPLAGHDRVRLRELFSSVWGTTGFVVVGPRAKRVAGPVVAVVEDIERFSPLLRTAEQIAGSAAAPVEMLLAAQGPGHAVDMEAQARLILNTEGRDYVTIVTLADSSAARIGETLRALGAGFVIAHYDGLAVPSEGEDTLLSENLEGPLLLVR
jgi:nucleotide-binding universal stress UspA family protein